MVKVIATQRVPYGKRHYASGEDIEATEKDARLLVAIGLAREPDAHSVTDLPKRAVREPAAGSEPIEERAAEAVVEEAEPEAPARPQTYDTRRLEAGPTGPTKQSPSSRQARPRKGKR